MSRDEKYDPSNLDVYKGELSIHYKMYHGETKNKKEKKI